MIDNLSHYGDMLAIPLFALAAIYFYNIKHKTLTEYILLLFSILGLVLDIFFTYEYLNNINK
jgi:hypothetical protein